jgi:hypothetical protein
MIDKLLNNSGVVSVEQSTRTEYSHRASSTDAWVIVACDKEEKEVYAIRWNPEEGSCRSYKGITEFFYPYLTGVLSDARRLKEGEDIAYAPQEEIVIVNMSSSSTPAPPPQGKDVCGRKGGAGLQASFEKEQKEYECAELEAMVHVIDYVRTANETWIMEDHEEIEEMITDLLADPRVAYRNTTTINEIGTGGDMDAILLVVCNRAVIERYIVYWKAKDGACRSYEDMRAFFDPYVREATKKEQGEHSSYEHTEQLEIIKLEY